MNGSRLRARAQRRWTIASPAKLLLGLAPLACAGEAQQPPDTQAGASAPAEDAPRADGSEAPAPPEAAVVTMTDNRFAPGTVRVVRGGTVVWRNTSRVVHTVTGEGFNSGNLAPGATWRRSFDAPGTYSYHCIPHRQAGMVGTVVVE